MTTPRVRNALSALTIAVLLGAAGCGGEDEPSVAQRCIDSWNAEANESHHVTIAGVVSAVGMAPDEFRVGEWTEPERTVPVWSPDDAFADPPTDESTVATDNCVVVVPESHVGDMTFFGDEGQWQFVKDGTGSKFPADARRSLADADLAAADALGKLEQP